MRPDVAGAARSRRFSAFAAWGLGLLAALALSVPATVRAQAQATSARVLFYGDFSGQKPSAEILAGPGTRFGLEIAPEDGPKNAPVVIEVRLTRPDTAGDEAPVVFLVAGRMGQAVQLAYEFAYEWEIAPGSWTMEALCGETRLTGAVFAVTKAPPSDKPAREKAAVRQADKPADKTRPEKSADKPAEKSADKPAARTAEPRRDRAPVPLTSPSDSGAVKAPGRLPGGAPGRRVYVVVAGSFSEEGRALWVAALLKGQGASTCVRRFESGGRRLWSVVLGWRDNLEDARRLRDDMARVAKDLAVTPMSAGDLEAGLVCK